MKSNQSNREDRQHSHKPHTVRLPGFISDEQIGLGDLIKRATSAAGIKACDGCRRRAAALNRFMVFNGGRSR